MNDNSIIERLTKATHSPKGEFAANDDNFELLKQRLSDKPVSRPEVKSKPRLLRRIAIAASVLIISGIGFAMVNNLIFNSSKSVNESEASAIHSVMPERTLNYSDTPLSDIIHDLEESYAVTITVTDSTRLDYHMTATFSTSEDLYSILDALATVASFDYTVALP